MYDLTGTGQNASIVCVVAEDTPSFEIWGM